MSLVPPLTELSWNSPEARLIIRGIIEGRLPQWPSGPRPDQVLCWSYVLAGRHTIIIAATGYGKTAAFFGPILILQHLLANPIPRLPKPPDKPVALIVTPLIELGNAHAREISTLGLRSVSVNAQTLQEASKNGRDLMREIRECDWSVVLLSAERLISREVDIILRDEVFRKNLALLGMDEAHLLIEWGKDFRTAYQQIALLRFRLPEHTTVVAATATMSNHELRALLGDLKLKAEDYELIRLPSERPNLQFIFTNLSHSISGYTFPDIKWVFKKGVKAIVYCATLELCFRVAVYGWSLYGAASDPLSNVRMWTSLTSSSYNDRTLDLFAHNEDTSVIIATIAFGMGMNLQNITDVVNLGLPSTLSALVQQSGRAGRDRNSTARASTYIEPSITTAITNELLEDMGPREVRNKPKPKPAKLKRADNLDVALKSVLCSHYRGHCVIVPMNVALSNAGPQSLLTCVEAKRSLFCSSCQVVRLPPPSNPVPVTVARVRKNNGGPQPHAPITRIQRENARVWLNDFATSRWILKESDDALWLPASTIWDGISLDNLLSNMHLLRSLPAVQDFLAGWQHLDSDGQSLSELLGKLNKTFDEQNIANKEEKSRKSAESREKKKAGAVPAIATRPSSHMSNDKENNRPIQSLPPTTSSKLTIRLPPASHRVPLAPTVLQEVEDDGWEPPPMEQVLPPRAVVREKRHLDKDAESDPGTKRQRTSPSTLTIA